MSRLQNAMDFLKGHANATRWSRSFTRTHTALMDSLLPREIVYLYSNGVFSPENCSKVLSD